jgi:hypothetical protein
MNAEFRKSSYSNSNAQQCVEIGNSRWACRADDQI